MGKKPLKNIDSAARSRYFKVASRTFPPVGIIGLVVGVLIYKSLLKGLIIGCIAGILASIFVHLIIEHLGSFGVNFLYGRRRPIWSASEKFEGPLNQARHLKSKNDFAKAHAMVNDVLSKAPDLPEALYLKAQILWEGYQDLRTSQDCLRRILEILPDKNDTYHQWALSLLDDMKSK